MTGFFILPILFIPVKHCISRILQITSLVLASKKSS